MISDCPRNTNGVSALPTHPLTSQLGQYSQAVGETQRKRYSTVFCETSGIFELVYHAEASLPRQNRLIYHILSVIWPYNKPRTVVFITHEFPCVPNAVSGADEKLNKALCNL